MVERTCILSEGRILTERDLVAAMSTPAPTTAAVAPSAPPDGDHLFSTAQRDQIEHVLKEVRGNKTAAAQLLGMSRRSLYRWLDRLNIEK